MIGAIAGGVLQAGLGIAQMSFARKQKRRARNELNRLNRNEPEIYVSGSLKKRLNEPYSAELAQSMVDGRRRRTASAISALDNLDPNNSAAYLNKMMEGERQAEYSQLGQLEQKRLDALDAVGRDEARVQTQIGQRWMNKVQGARGELGAGEQNTFTGATGMSEGLSFLADTVFPDGL